MKEGRISASWGYVKDEGLEDLYYTNGPGTSSSDAQLMHYFFDCVKTASGKNFVEELESRGYDLKTLKLTVEKVRA